MRVRFIVMSSRIQGNVNQGASTSGLQDQRRSKRKRGDEGDEDDYNQNGGNNKKGKKVIGYIFSISHSIVSSV